MTAYDLLGTEFAYQNLTQSEIGLVSKIPYFKTNFEGKPVYGTMVPIEGLENKLIEKPVIEQPQVEESESTENQEV